MRLEWDALLRTSREELASKANKLKDRRRKILFRSSTEFHLGHNSLDFVKRPHRTPGGKTPGWWLRSGFGLMIMCRQSKQEAS